MAVRGVASWMSSQRATRASLSPSPAKGSQRKTHDISGRTSDGSSRKYSQLSLFSRTCKDTSSEDSTRSSVTLTGWGSMLSGAFTPLPKPVLPTAEHGSLSWPTPTANRYGSSNNGSPGDGREQYRTKGNPSLHTLARLWPTPNALISNDGESLESFLKRKEKWAHKYRNGMPLSVKVQQWPTPAARDYKGANSAEHCQVNGTGRKHMDQLPNYVAHSFQSGPQAPKATGQESQNTSGRRLNPLFVEWLMGFPDGWTDCEPSETLSSHSKQFWLCGISSGGSADV